MRYDFLKIILKFLEPKPGGGALSFWDPDHDLERCGGNFNMKTGKLMPNPIDQKAADDHCKRQYDGKNVKVRCKLNTEWTESSGVDQPDCSPATICGRCHFDGTFFGFLAISIKVLHKKNSNMYIITNFQPFFNNL